MAPPEISGYGDAYHQDDDVRCRTVPPKQLCPPVNGPSPAEAGVELGNRVGFPKWDLSETGPAQASEAWGAVVVGHPVADIEPKPPPGPGGQPGFAYRPDTVLDGWSTSDLTVRLASIRGYQHRYDTRPREDDVAATVHTPTGTLVFAVADGVSAAQQSHVGAALACRGALEAICAQLDTEPGGIGEWDAERAVRSAAWQLLTRVTTAKEPSENEWWEAEQRLATTLVAGTVRIGEHGVLHARLVQVGDSGAWLLRGGVFESVLESKMSAAGEVLSSAVVPLPRGASAPVQRREFELLPDTVLLVGTDGFGDPLGDGTGAVGELFAGGLRTPPSALRLAHLLDFSRETFDDDRTLLAVWPRHMLPGEKR